MLATGAQEKAAEPRVDAGADGAYAEAAGGPTLIFQYSQDGKWYSTY
jgi:hypothetical protein